jgi:hypothetical protein
MEYAITPGHRIPQTIGGYPGILGHVDEEDGLGLDDRLSVVRRVESSADH